MRIALVAPYNLEAVGGVERYILSFAKASQQDHEVTIFTDSKPVLDDVQVLPLAAVDSMDFDLCLTHAIYGSEDLPRARRYVHTFHGTILGNLRVRPWLWIHPRFLQWLRLEFNSLKGKHGTVGVSQRACDEIRCMGYNGPLLKLPSGGGFEGQEWEGAKDSGVLKCLYAGRISDKVKRFSMIEKGFRLARSRDPHLELCVLGGSKGNHQEGVTFMGEQPYEVGLQKVRESHLQMNASYYEGSSLALSEGIFQGGLLTLATRTGGNIDMLSEGKTGFFFHSAAELSVHLLRMRKDHSRRESMQKDLKNQSLVPSWNEVSRQVVEFAQSLGEN